MSFLNHRSLFFLMRTCSLLILRIVWNKCKSKKSLTQTGVREKGHQLAHRAEKSGVGRRPSVVWRAGAGVFSLLPGAVRLVPLLPAGGPHRWWMVTESPRCMFSQLISPCLGRQVGFPILPSKVLERTVTGLSPVTCPSSEPVLVASERRCSAVVGQA